MRKAVRTLFIYLWCYNNRPVIKHLSATETYRPAVLRLRMDVAHPFWKGGSGGWDVLGRDICICPLS